MKIYTGKGDSGMTGLPGGERVSKTHPRIEAFGTVDELNSVIGALAASLKEGQCAQGDTLRRIQSDLLVLGSRLARTPDSGGAEKPGPFAKEGIRFLEGAIDRLQRLLPELKEFVLPGGHVSSAWAHVARTVCRRAERRVAALQEASPPPRGGRIRSAGCPGLSEPALGLSLCSGALVQLHGGDDRHGQRKMRSIPR